MEYTPIEELREIVTNTIRKIEQERRDELRARVSNVLVDLTDYLMGVIRTERDGKEEWGYRRRDELVNQQKELADSIVELLMPETKKEDD